MATLTFSVFIFLNWELLEISKGYRNILSRKHKTLTITEIYKRPCSVCIPVSVHLPYALEQISPQYPIFVVSRSSMEQITAKQVGPTLVIDWEKWAQLQTVKALFKSPEDVLQNPRVVYELLKDINNIAQAFKEFLTRECSNLCYIGEHCAYNSAARGHLVK